MTKRFLTLIVMAGIAVMGGGLAACSTPTSNAVSQVAAKPVDPISIRNRITEIQIAYHGALVLAVAYTDLPRCQPGSPTLCSNQRWVNQIRKADDVAKVAVDEADKAGNNLGSKADVAEAVIVSAAAAVDALKKLATAAKQGG